MDDIIRFEMSSECQEMLNKRLLLVCDPADRDALVDAFLLAHMRTLADEYAVRTAVANLLVAPDDERKVMLAMTLQWRENTLSDHPVMGFTHRLFAEILKRNDRPSFHAWEAALCATAQMMVQGYDKWDDPVPPVMSTNEIRRMQPSTGMKQ